ncbi:MAG TPA: HIRAN domain-containing protein [Allosphingosinicella sp.]|nr:HIRAN domain-containing protein [Allosphingosinicella sp.]
MSLAVVGADYPNRRGPGRRFEIEICTPGETVELAPEPRNPADPRAIAVLSCRGIQIGYLTAERCGWIGSMMSEGRPISVIFQRKATFGAVIRLAFDGEKPTLPPERKAEPGTDAGDDRASGPIISRRTIRRKR